MLDAPVNWQDPWEAPWYVTTQFGAEVYFPPVKFTVQAPGPAPPETLEISLPGLLKVFVIE